MNKAVIIFIYFSIWLFIILILWLWQDKNKLLLNLKDSEKNNKEINKSLQLFNNKEYKEEPLIKSEDNKSPPEPNNMKLNTKPQDKQKSLPEDKPN